MLPNVNLLASGHPPLKRNHVFQNLVVNKFTDQPPMLFIAIVPRAAIMSAQTPAAPAGLREGCPPTMWWHALGFLAWRCLRKCRAAAAPGHCTGGRSPLSAPDPAAATLWMQWRQAIVQCAKNCLLCMATQQANTAGGMWCVASA